jgi:signal transduction histidine kinase
MLLALSVMLTAFFIVSISTFVFARNQKSSVNIIFSLFGLCVGAWIVVNFLGANFKNWFLSPFLIRSDFFLGPWLAYLFWKFTTKLSKTLSVRVRIIDKILLLVSLLASLSGLTNIAIAVHFTDGKANIQYTALYVVYSMLLLIISGLGLLQLFVAHKRAEGPEKSQIAIMILGLGVAITFVIIPNLLVPQITDSVSINLLAGNLAYIGLGFFVAATAYAIVIHKLFDIRLVVARSLAYVMSLAVIVGLYAIVIFGLFNRFGGYRTSTTFQQVFYLLTAVLLGFVFPQIKRFFDKLTNQIFYRDAYDTQMLLNEFNEALVSTIELDKLLSRSSVIIEKYLKPEFCSFALHHKSDSTIRLIGGNNSRVISKEFIEQARAYLHDFKRKLYLTDTLEFEDTELKTMMQQVNIGVIARVGKNSGQEGLGYIIMGYKKSGNIYNSQDINALEILSNELAIAIENALQYEEIQNFAKTLQVKVDDATKDLRVANEKLKKMDQTKDDFISMASHQLRTPLTSVKGYVSMVLEGDAGPINAQQKKLLDQSFISSQRMVYLIADLLNVSRLKTGKFIIDAKPTNLADVVEGELAQLYETAKARDLELTYKKPENFPVLMLDDTKIRQVIMNFADNAIYYTPAGGHIKVSVVDKGETIEFTVVDDGIGVPKSEEHHLFNKFYRAGNAKKARPDGTGLGLFMAKKVIIAQGGSVIFHTEQGKGSTFGFSFAKAPLDPDHYQPPKPVSNET